jgi:hypothetical protein
LHQKKENMMERLLDVEVTQDGAIIGELELICCISGFGCRFLFHHMVEGFFRFAELGPS